MAEPRRYFEEVVLKYEGDECLKWPFAHAKGYGTIWHIDRVRRVHNLVCEIANGPPPTPKHEAAHSCGNGIERCCTKKHLSWKTHAENMADTITHGTNTAGERHWHAKLTAQQVREILALKGQSTHAEIGKMYGVHPATICSILNGTHWRSVK